MKRPPRRMEDHRPAVQEFLKKLDKAIKANPLPKQVSVFKMGLVKSVPKRISVGGTCGACTKSTKPLWEHTKGNGSKVNLCTGCSERFQYGRRKVDAISRALPGSYGSKR